MIITSLLAASPTVAFAQSDAGVGDAAKPDGGLDSGAPPVVRPLYFDDKTDISFPTPACADPANANAVGCFTSFLVLSDLEADGDMDIVFANGGGYYVTGNAESSVVYLNDGKGAFRDVTAAQFGDAKSRLRQVAIGDIDGDGDMDIYQPGGFGVDVDKLWVQTSKGKFENKADVSLPLTGVPADGGVATAMMSKAGSAHLGDIDGDGDLDLVIGDWGNMTSRRRTVGATRIYFNDGKGVFTAGALDLVPAPLLAEQPLNDAGIAAGMDGGAPAQIIGSVPIDLDLSDIDGDFDLDIVLLHRDGQSRIFINDGKAKFSDATGNYPIKKGPYSYNQEMCDFDEDGDLDMLVDNAGGVIPRAPSGQPANPLAGDLTQINVNDGKGMFSDMTSSIVRGEPGGDDNAVKCSDVNGDGHYDLVVASLTRQGEKLLLNDGKGTFDFVDNAFPRLRDPSLGIDSADLNGDGVFDYVTGQGEGNLRLDRVYFGANQSKKDITPPRFRAVESVVGVPNASTFIRMAVVDGVTSETGEHVKYVGVEYSVDGGALKMAQAKFIGGDIFRVEIPAQPNGSLVKVTPTATDRAGLIGKGASFNLLIGMEIPDAGVVDTRDSGVDMNGGLDSGTPTKPTIDAGTMEPNEGPGEEPKDDDDGCSVSARDANIGSSGIFFMLGLALLAARRTRLFRGLRVSSKKG